VSLDIFTNVVTTYKANVDDHVRKLEKLTDAEKKHAQATIDAQKQTSTSLQSHIELLGKVGLAVGAAAGAAKLAWDGFQATMERSRLEAAAGAIDLDRLKAAARGLKTETDLLSDAARLQHGQFKLNQYQIEMVEQAMLALNKRGFESQKVHESVLQAVTALKTEGLDDLGLHIDKAGLSMEKASDRAEVFEKIMRELGKVSRDVADGQSTAAEKVQATAVTFQDAMDTMSRALGQLVIAMAPLLEGLAKAVSDIAAIANAAGKGVSSVPGLGKAVSASKYFIPGVGWFMGAKDIYDAASGGGLPGSADIDAFGGTDTYSQVPDMATAPDTVMSPYEKQQWQALLKAREEAAKRAAEAAKARAEAYREMVRQLANEGAKRAGESVIAQLEAELGTPQSVGIGISDPGYGDLQGTLNRIDFDQRRSALGQQRTSALEGIFGPLEQFNAYKAAWDTLSSSVNSAYSAIVDGSMGAGKAVKLAIAQALKGEGAHMQALALKEFGLGLASIALGPVGGVSAAAHFQAAAFLEAGAIATGVLAHELGGGGGGAGGGRGAGAAAPTGRVTGVGGPDQGGGRDVIIVYTDPFANDTARSRQLEADRIVAKALGGSGGKNK